MTSYKSKETVYSTLRLSKRMNEMLTTIFAQSPAGVKNEVRRISEMMAYLGLRSYLFFYEDTTSKSSHIKQNLKNIKGCNFIVKFAQKMPRTFSFISNIAVPFAQSAMNIYRYIKYR